MVFFNILFLFVDDMWASVFINLVIKIFNLDCLRFSGMLFMEVYIMGVDNGVVCVLSWVMFMIGRYLSCFLLAGFNILDDYVFFGEIL